MQITLNYITHHKVSVFTAAENSLPLLTCFPESPDESCRIRLWTWPPVDFPADN